MMAFETACAANTVEPDKKYFLNYYNDNSTGEYTSNCKFDKNSEHYN